MTKMNWVRANKKQRTGKAQSEHAEADRPTYSPEQALARLELQEHRILKKKELRLQNDLEEQKIRKESRANFIEKNKLLLEEQVQVLGCKPDGSDSWAQLQKLIKENPDEKSKYWLAYHRLNEIVNTFY